MTVKVIGAGLAGCEAAWQLAKEGIKVELYEMKPKKFSPAHSNENFAELVCSNSLKADRIENACGLLKEEMRFFDSVMMEAADKCRVPAGGALAVDREMFSACITEKIKAHGLITVVNEEVVKINPDEYTIIATGPLTSSSLSQAISELTGDEELYFYDAAAPVITEESIDKSKVFKAARYDKYMKHLIVNKVSVVIDDKDLYWNLDGEKGMSGNVEVEVLKENVKMIEFKG